MKQILFFMTCFGVTLTALAQNEFTGNGDGYSWEDDNNWSYGSVPYDGEDILISGFAIGFYGSPYTYGSLDLRNGANLFVEGELNLYGDLIVDPTAIISITVTDLTDFSKVIVGGNYFFAGEADVLFSFYVPQIGNSFQLIQGSFGSCNTPTTDIIPENQSGGGYQTYLAVQCESEGILFTVTDINYTTAISWDGEAGDNQWGTAANWDSNGVPTLSDRVIINLSSGATVYTSETGTANAYLIHVGDNNNLVVNGDLDMFSSIGVNAAGSLNWKGGTLSRTDVNVQSFIMNRGSLLVDGPANKALENGFKIYSQGNDASFVITEKGFDINDGEVSIYNGDLLIDGDDITIGYSSGSQHALRMWNNTALIKTSGSGTSSINLTNFITFSSAHVICEAGTLPSVKT